MNVQRARIWVDEMSEQRARILCLDFDGVLHSYKSGWQGPTKISDPPVEGYADFLERAVGKFYVMIFGSRSTFPGGIEAMRNWLQTNLTKDKPGNWWEIFNRVHWTAEKPAAFLTLDDRAMRFSGEWPDIDEVDSFKSWVDR